MGRSQGMCGSDLNLTFTLPCSNLLGKNRAAARLLYFIALYSSHEGLKAADTDIVEGCLVTCPFYNCPGQSWELRIIV